MLFKAILLLRQTHALGTRAKTRASSSQKTLPPPLKSQSMQHLRKQVIRSFQIEGGVHDLLQCQPIKNGEQESRQDALDREMNAARHLSSHCSLRPLP